jgi:hypothetical protein
MAKQALEHTLYPVVEKWLKRHLRCFHVSIAKGLKYSRIDALGIRDIGGNLSGDVESIAVEVKRGLTPFTNAAGQTVGYKVYADRVYLADSREKAFTYDEIDIASNLGIGLIQIKRGKCHEVLSSPKYLPIRRLQLQLFRSLRLGKCQFCGSFFNLGHGNWANVSDSNLKKAIAKEKGLIFVLHEVEERKIKLGWSQEKDVYNNYRFICPDCVANVLGPLRETRQ